MPQSSSKSKRLPYFSSAEVAAHNLASDCWVSYFGHVYDLTSLVKEHAGLLVQPILRFAGQDITHWFDAKTKEPKTCVSPSLGITVTYCPFGRYVHIPPAEPSAAWDTDFDTPWWKDQKYLVGHLSSRTRKLKVLNMLSGQTATLNVCSEETLDEIQTRYLKYNAHASSYTWKWLNNVLDLSKTLEENGVKDESEEMAKLNLDEDEYIPTLHVYFNDDLTIG